MDKPLPLLTRLEVVYDELKLLMSHGIYAGFVRDGIDELRRLQRELAEARALVKRAQDAALHAQSHCLDAQARANERAAYAEGFKWVPVTERLPATAQSVALVHIERWENTEGHERNYHACGYLWGLGGHVFWSVRGERAVTVETFTHWMPLPDPPKQVTEEGDSQG